MGGPLKENTVDLMSKSNPMPVMATGNDNKTPHHHGNGEEEHHHHEEHKINQKVFIETYLSVLMIH